MNKTVNKAKIISSLIWKLLERCGTLGIQFVIQIVLARILMPDDYGVIALVTVFIALANIFVESGFSTALIQKKDADEIDFSSVFYLSLIVSGILYIFLFFTSPLIAKFYDEPNLIYILRVLSITLFFGALNSIQSSYMARNMMFKKSFLSNLGAVIVSGSFGITAAHLGLGVWALVIQQLVSNLSVSIILWFTVKWRPRLFFSLERIKQLFSFGWKLLVASIINTFSRNLRSLIIGKIFSPSILGFYNKGRDFPNLIVSNIDGSIQSVMLPSLSTYQDNKAKLKDMVRRSIATSSFLIFPMMVGLAVVSRPLVRILLTDKWLPAVPFIQIFCASFALWPIHTANLQAINAVGRSDIFLKLEIIKKLLDLIIVFISLFFSVYALAIGNVFGGILSSFINAYPNKKLLDYSYKEQWKDIIPSLLTSIIMGGFVYCIYYLNMPDLITLVIQVTLGSIFYFLLAYILKMESFLYIIKVLHEFRSNRCSS